MGTNAFLDALAQKGIPFDPNAPPPPPGVLPETPQNTDAAVAALQAPQSVPVVTASPGADVRAIARGLVGQPPPPAPVDPVVARARELAPQGQPPPSPMAMQARAALGQGGGGGGGSMGEHIAARQQVGAATQDELRAERTAQTLLADTLDQQRADAEQRQVVRDAQRAQREKAVGDQTAQLDRQIAERAAMPIDSSRVFRSPGGMLMAIGAVLGSGAAERGGSGGNQGLAILQNALSSDLADQKAEIARAGEGIEARRNLIGTMRAIHADHDQADLAAEIVQKELAAKQIEAEGARWKVPAIEAKAKAAAGVLRDEVQTLRDRYNAMSAAASDKMWNRAMEVEKLRLEQRKIDAEGGKRTDEGAKFVASEMQKAGIPQARASADRAAAEIRKAGNIANMNVVSNAFAQNFPTLYGMVSDGAEAQQAYQGFKSDIMHRLSGAAVSPTELTRLNAMLESAGTPAARLRAISNAQEALDAAEANIKAGASPDAVAEYESRQSARAPTTSTQGIRFTPGAK